MLDFFRRHALALAVFAAMLALYLLTLTQVHTFDAYSYAMAVQTKPWRETFHPHHLAYGPTGALAYGLARMFGYAGQAFGPLQLINALAGAAGVALWVSTLRWLTGRLDLALLGGGLLGAAYAWWYYAVEVEVYTLAALFLIMAVAVLLRLLRDPAWRGGWIGLGLALSGAVLFHQTNVLWAAPAAVGAILARWSVVMPPARRLRLAGLAVAVGLAVVGGAYALVMFGWSGFRTWSQVRAWLFEYAATGFWGGPIGLRTLGSLGAGWSFALASGGGGLVLVLAATLIALRWRAVWAAWRGEAAVALAWLIAYVLFFGWWEADNIEFWIAALPPLILLVVLALDTLSGRPRRVTLSLGALVALLLLAENGLAIVRRGDRADDQDRAVVTDLAAAGAPEDLYIVPNGLQELYLRYEFARPNTLALSLGAGDWEAGCATLRAAIADTAGAGYNVWIDRGVLEPTPELLARYHLEGAAVRACFAPFAADQAAAGGWRDLGRASYGLLSPTPQALPDWRWRDWTLGWKPNFIAESAWADGWSFVPGDDPHVLSPRLRLAAADWSAIEITMATTIAGQHGQFYWIAPGAGASEDRSVAWDVIADGQPHTYAIPLRDQPGWNGPLGLLRIDPVVAGDGSSRVTLLRVRLVK